MKNISTAVFAVILLFAAMGCSLIDKVTSTGQSMTKVGELWSDVPRMDGLKASDMEIPVGYKLIIRTIISNMGSGNKNAAEDAGKSDIDWTALSGAVTTADIQKFYTAERMTSSGNWDAPKGPACIDGKDKGVDGTICFFQKESPEKSTNLMILAAPDSNTKQTNVFYIRLEGEKKPGKAVSNK